MSYFFKIAQKQNKKDIHHHLGVARKFIKFQKFQKFQNSTLLISKDGGETVYIFVLYFSNINPYPLHF